MIDYRLKTFLELYETMNYRETARRLNMTQPAVTQHIQALQNEYGCKLFCYDRKKLSRTQKADVLALYSRTLIYNDKLFRQKISDNAKPVLRIGATKTIGEFVIGDIVQRYLENEQNRLSLFVENTENLLHRLEHGELDFAVVEGSFDKQKYDFQLFRHEPFVGICAANHPFAGKTVDVHNIFDNTLIVREDGSGTRAILERMLFDGGYKISNFKRSICISNFTMIRRLVSSNSGISFAYKAVADSDKNISVFTIKNMPQQHDFNYVYLKNTDVSAKICDFEKK